MENIKHPFRGITKDIKGRASCYKNDWINSFNSGIGILNPAACMFFTSILPAIAFGEQLKKKTGGSLSTVQTLASTAISGMIQSVFGGQPLLILGIAEPTVLMYTFLYNFTKQRDNLGHHLFLAWTAWVCVWTSLLLMLLAIVNAANIVDRFITRVTEELLEMLIALLFIQEAVKGIISEFQVPKGVNQSSRAYQFDWLYTNGVLAVIFCFGFLYTALKCRRARSWWCGTGIMRHFIADFGVPLMVVVWTALSFGVPEKVPSGVPRRLFSPHPWQSDSLHPWTITKRMAEVPSTYIFGAFIPALMLAGLFFFEHNVASKLAQQKDFNLKNPSSYHYDIFLLGIMTLLSGLLGLPPSYALLPHSPMHTKSLVVLKRKLMRKKIVESAKESIRQKASNTEMYENMQAAFLELDINPITNGSELDGLKKALMKEEGENGLTTFDPERNLDGYLPVSVNDQRLSNLLQSVLLVMSVFAMPAINLMPSSLLFGYFAYMAIDGLPGNQFWERIQLLFVTKERLHKVLEGNHASYLELVPYRHIASFTIFQMVYMLICYGMTWIPLVGILFPLAFFGLIIIRHCVLPKYFQPNHLHELDALEYEEVLGTSRRSLACMSPFRGHVTPNFGIDEEEMEDQISDSELLDELTTHRGELKVRTVSFRSERCTTSGRKGLELKATSFRYDKLNKIHAENIV